MINESGFQVNVLKEKIDRREKLKEVIKSQLTAGGILNLRKVVNTFGGDNPVLTEVIFEWANEGLQKIKTITSTSEVEAAFIKMFDGLYANVWFEKHPNSLFVCKGDPAKPEYWFELENSNFWCSYDRVWEIFSNEYSMEYSDIQDLIKPLVEEAFRLRGITPMI